LLERVDQLRGGGGSGGRGWSAPEIRNGNGGSSLQGREVEDAGLAPLRIETTADPYLGHPAIGTYSETQACRRDREKFYDSNESDVWDDVIRVVTHEGPVHQDVVIVRVARMYKLLRTGSLVEQVITAHIREAIRKGHIRQQGEFLRSWRTNQVKPR